MAILSNKNTPRVSYVASGSQTVFAINFEFFSTDDIKVYNGTTLLTYNATPSSASQYSITGTAASSDDAYEFGSGGSITLGGSGASASDIITIIRDISIERTSDFPPTGSFDITSLNTQLDQIIAEIADRKQQSDRSVKLADSDSVAADLTLPPKATRASKVLEFDSDGDVATTLSTANLSTLAGLTSEIATVAGISSNITTVAGISANVTSVAGISGHITTVAGISSDISTVSSNDANITTCATNIAAINNASTNATNAAASATSASSSATAAAASASAAATSADNFDDVYLGAKSSAPSVDNDGDALTTGDLYFDTTSGTLNVYNGSTWVQITVDTDVKTGVSSNDTTAGYLNGKLIAGEAVTLTENSDGGNETLTVAAVDPTPLAIALG